MIKTIAPPQSEAELKTLSFGINDDAAQQSLLIDETDEVLINPGKGWVVHYFDNTLTRYGQFLKQDDLEDFEGLAVIYMRLAWSYLEPEEKLCNWEIIDAPMRRWNKLGKKIALRITCCEDDPQQPYATPQWVFKAGAKAVEFRPGVFEPDYSDPVFQEKLGNFLTALAAHYDGKSEVAFIDIGSYGVGGTWKSAGTAPSIDTRKVLIDQYARAFRKSQLMIPFFAGKELCDYARQVCCAGLRGGSICSAESYSEFGGYWSEKICSGAQFDFGYFGDFYPEYPVILEPAPYDHAKKNNTWQNGSVMERAVKELHGSWCCCRHWPREFLNENRALVRDLANRMGYWFFLKNVTMPRIVNRGERFATRTIWENRGSAPVYKAYYLAMSLVNEEGQACFRTLNPAVNAHRWKSGQTEIICPQWEIPADLAAGTYRLRLGLVSNLEEPIAPIRIGAKNTASDNFVEVGEIHVN